MNRRPCAHLGGTPTREPPPARNFPPRPPPPPGAHWQARKAEYTLQRQEDGSFLLDGTVELGALDPEAAVLPWLTGEGLVIDGTGGVAAVTATHLELVLPGTATRAVATVRAASPPATTGESHLRILQ